MFPIEHFWRAARRYPANIAVRTPTRDVTYSELAGQVAALACAIQARSPNADDRIGIGSRNSLEHLVALLAVLASGRIWVPLNPRGGTPDLLRIVEFTEPALLFLEAAMAERLGDVAAPVITLEGTGRDSLAGLVSGSFGGFPDRVNMDLGSAQAIKFTGGTTGAPKGVMQTFRSWNTVIVSKWAAFGFHERERFLIAAPLTHGSSTYVLPVLGQGGALVLAEDPKPASMLDAIEGQGVTATFLPPILIRRLVEENRIRRRRTGSLRSVIYAAAPMSVDDVFDTQSELGLVLATSYGQTEAPQIATVLPASEMMQKDLAASVGRPSILTDVAITDPAGRSLPAGEEGEVRIRGDIVMGGYWRAPERTADVIVDGWLRTGDRGYFDAHGYLFLKGRADDVVITGGFNVHPGDVESVIARHAAVLDCAVVGIRDAKWGEAVHAAVVLLPGGRVTEDELVALVKAELGSVNAPKHVHFLDSLPRTSVDKISRREIRTLIAQRIASGQD